MKKLLVALFALVVAGNASAIQVQPTPGIPLNMTIDGSSGSLPTGTNTIGGVTMAPGPALSVSLLEASRLVVVARYSATLTVDTDAYTASDALGGMFQFHVGNEYSSFIVNSAFITDLSDQKAHIDMYCFQDQYTPTADDAEFAPTDGDLGQMVLKINFSPASYESLASNAIGEVSRIGQLVKLSSTRMMCQCALGESDTPTYAGSKDIQISIEVLVQ